MMYDKYMYNGAVVKIMEIIFVWVEIIVEI